MKDAGILIIDDNSDILVSTRLLFKKQFTRVDTCEDPAVGLAMLYNQPYHVVLLDMNFSKGETSGGEGIHWLKKIKAAHPSIPVVMVTAFGDMDLAIKALKQGAIDFVLKPWQNEKLLATINSAYELSVTRQQMQSLKETNRIIEQDVAQDYHELIGTCAAMKKVNSLIERVAQTDANVLILGENGTGKEVVARAIHRLSKRNNNPFVKVDLGAIPETLFESELFGHKKGAFTDAKEDRTGRIEAANSGTLFFDEIGNLSPHLQSKLLSVLQNKQVVRIGSNIARNVDLRLISATNMPLHEMSQGSTFRKDLLYRINSVEIILPPLRERMEDIALLAEHYLQIYTRKYAKENVKFNADAMTFLRQYQWPGNVRELQHLVERAVILCESKTIGADDFFVNPTNAQDDELIKTLNLDELEKTAVKKALKIHNGNISRAAKELGLTRAALYRRMEKYGV